MRLNRVEIFKKLRETGTIDKSAFSKVMLSRKDRNSITLKVLAAYSGMTSRQINDFFEKHFGLPNIDLNEIAVNPEIADLLPFQFAVDHRILPAFKVMGKTHLAISNPFDDDGINGIKKYIGDNFSIFLAPEDQVLKTLDRLRKQAPNSEKDGKTSRCA